MEIIKFLIVAAWLGLLGLPAALADTPEFVWVAHAGGASGHAKTRGIAVDLSGNCYVTGEFSGTAVFGGTTLACQGPLDCYVAKFGPDGRALWAKQSGGAAIDRGYGVAVDAEGNCYVTGHFQNPAGITNAASAAKGRVYDIFVAKYDTRGNLAWQKQMPGNGYDYGHGVSLDVAGNAYVSGAFGGSVSFGGYTLTNKGSSEIFLAKFDAAGKVLWAEKAEAGTGNAANAIVHDRNGHCYVAGTFSGKANLGGRALASSGANDVLLVKFDAAGKPLWARRAGGTTNDFGHSVSVDSVGNCYISGGFQNVAEFGNKKLSSAGKHDAFVAKYDAEGNFQWVHAGGGEGTDYGLGVAVDAQQNCYLTGEFTGDALFGEAKLTNRGATDIFLAKINAAGKQEWIVSAGGAKTDYSYCIAVDGEHAYISGGFTGEATFGGKQVTSAGLSDMFVAKVRVKGK